MPARKQQVLKVDDDIAKSKCVRRTLAAHGGLGRGLACAVLPGFAPQQASHARDEDGKVERLGQIIVGPGFKSLQNVFRARACGQHQQGNVILGFAQSARHGEAVLAGKHYVQHQCVEIFVAFQETIERIFAIAHNLDGIALLLQIETEPLRQVGFIFHYEDPAHTG